ncbi:helix-turn-helix domain-containing protein [Ciceribacter sp. L1K22]|uniref:helix-turn-helix domain-containing protein n=1 Tax=Ciceribacter sp. L1K22 TaxID=2820275 RepID=UPI001ABE59A7|nr:helix-turn-helix domain-containing protein [Ciceribacter sp. L1K22]MBO3761003.1 sigma-54-dependent Fis family transcriptional regulator [Ciceribacter sp. L1K22]
MRQSVRHSDLVYATASRPSAAISSPIAASWIRCLDVHRLMPDVPRDPVQVDADAYTSSRESMEPLIHACADEFDRLYQTVGRSGCCIVLSDRHGVIVDRRGAASNDVEFKKLGLWQRNLWSEASVGTNGIGTALADERSVMIHRDQHFLSSNISLSCVTAPIRDHLGQVAGAIDISTCRDDVTDMTLAMLSHAVRDVAGKLETTLFRSAFPGARIVMVPSAPISSVALLAVDQHDMILGATKAARLALRLDDAQIRSGMPAADALNEDRREVSADLEEAERAALRRALSRSNGNVSLAAQTLGISRATMHRKLKRLSLQ